MRYNCAIDWYLKFKRDWLEYSKAIPANCEITEIAKKYMSKYGNEFEFIGAGSERATFKVANTNLCVKLCLPYDGHYQNQIQDEIRNVKSLKNPYCICRIFDWDELGFSSELCEYCHRVDNAVWLKTFGISYKMTCEICSQMVKHRSVQLPANLLNVIRAITFSNPNFIDCLLAESEPKYRALMSWIRAGIRTNGQKLRDAYGHIENWGLLHEDGNPVVKIIDAGM